MVASAGGGYVLEYILFIMFAVCQGNCVDADFKLTLS